MEEIDVTFKAPMSMTVIGPSGVGKTKFVRKFIESIPLGLMNERPTRIYWYFAHWQADYAEMQTTATNVVFRQGIPDTNEIEEGSLVVLDDLSYEGGALVARDMFTKLVHHKRMSVVYIAQNLFAQSKGSRDVTLNTQYIVLFRNVADKTQVMLLARRIFPENPNYMMDAYTDATRPAYGYLLLDLRSTTADKDRLRTQIFPAVAGGIGYIYRPLIKKTKAS